MSVIVRAATYATLFIGLVLVFLPSRLLSWAGITRPAANGLQQVLGAILTAAGAVLAFWCVVSFIRAGKGTPAPFDPPRRLVISGPYRFVRNPMYIGAGLALLGAALYYGSLELLAYEGLLSLAAHLFIVLHEEPALERRFGPDYSAYCCQVGRWFPRLWAGRSV